MNNNHYNLLLNQYYFINNYISYLNSCNQTINNLNQDILNSYRNYNNQDYNYNYNYSYSNQEENNNTNNYSNSYSYEIPILETNNNSEYSIEYFRALSNQNIENLINDNIDFKKYIEIVNPIDEKCGITQEDFNNDDDVGIFKTCHHIFTKHNLLNWTRRNLSCPNCRDNMLYNTDYIKYSEVDNLTSNNLDNVYIFSQQQLSRFLSWRLTNGFIR